VDRDPARIELEAKCTARPASDCRSEQRPADSRERIEDELVGSREELDEARHEARRLVCTVRLARVVAELGRVCRAPDRLREIEPFLPRQLVERVVGVRRATTVGHDASLPEPAGA
jgi:hypothetical protein